VNSVLFDYLFQENKSYGSKRPFAFILWCTRSHVEHIMEYWNEGVLPMWCQDNLAFFLALGLSETKGSPWRGQVERKLGCRSAGPVAPRSSPAWGEYVPHAFADYHINRFQSSYGVWKWSRTYCIKQRKYE
jgi:hypothetical protein